MAACDAALIEAHLDRFYEEFVHLLEADEWDDLKVMYQLVQRCPTAVAHFKTKLEEFIHAQVCVDEGRGGAFLRILS